MNGVRHELLEACVLDTGDALRAREVRCRLISTRLTLTRVIYQKLRHLSERPTLFAVVDDQSDAACLRRTNALLDAVCEIRAARADVRAEDIRAIALIVNPTGQWAHRVMEGCRVTEDIQRRAADRRQKNVQVATRDQLRIHAGGLLEQGSTQ